MKIIEVILQKGAKVKINNGPCFNSFKLELSEVKNTYLGKEGIVGIARLSDEGIVYYPVSFENNEGVSSLLVPSYNLIQICE